LNHSDTDNHNNHHYDYDYRFEVDIHYELDILVFILYYFKIMFKRYWFYTADNISLTPSN